MRYNQIKQQMQQLAYLFPIYSHYSASSTDGKEDHLSHSENTPSFEQAEKCELLRKIQYLSQRCEFLELQNEGLKDSLKQNNKIQIKIEVFQRNQCLSQQSLMPNRQPKREQEKQPKKRRTEKELTKNFKCPYSGCKKDYASALALNLHMRVKHGGGTKKERKQLLKEIIDAELKGGQLPKINLNLPPNYLEEKKKLILFCEEFHKPEPHRNHHQ